MRKKVIAVAACIAAIAFRCDDTEVENRWRRTIEPRIARAAYRECAPKNAEAGRVVHDAQCAAAAPPGPIACDELQTADEAVRAFALERRCVDEAIAILERTSAADVAWLSDLSAAFYVRAQRDDRASDLLRALDAARRAPRNEISAFNLALAQEAIGLRDEAVASWTIAARDRSVWGNEARDRLRRLRSAGDVSPATHWRRNRNALPAALKARDGAKVASLIELFPREAWDYFGEEVLPSADSPAITLFATKLAERLGGERYLLDVAQAAPRNVRGHAAYRARKLDEASRHLREGRSPFYLEVEISRATKIAQMKNRVSEARVVLDAVDAVVRARGDRYLTALVDSSRGYIAFRASHFVESNAANDAAAATFALVRDAKGVAAMHRTSAGNYRSMGLHELSWREAVVALRHQPLTANTRIRHTARGEAASTALALGYRDVALELQNSAIALIDDHSPQLATALRERARIELHFGRYDRALRDLADATHRLSGNFDPENRRALRALAAEVEGQARLPLDPARAAALFTTAIEGLGVDELRTFRASLFAQRADAQRRLGRAKELEADLQASLRELNAEELEILQHRDAEQEGNPWASYFGRFQETYDRLIALLIEQNRDAEAFAYAERARAFEPLHLLLQNDTVPAAFRALTRDGQPVALADIRRHLPPGTYMLYYAVTEEQTFAWLVSRDRIELRKLHVREREVQRWVATLQDAGRRRDAAAFEAGLPAPHEKLIAPLLQPIGQANIARLVIVPDGAMNGLPFAALRDRVERRYLIERAPIEIAGSASLYLFSLLRSRELSRSTSALLIGDPTIPRLSIASGLKPLPGARREVARIRQIHPASEILTGEAATAGAFFSSARDKAIIHFAGHAIANPGDAAQSILLFAPSPAHAGAVEAQELLRELDLDRTRLVFLSTCSSAGGFPVGPQGVAPLVRPLIAAGVPAVVGSLWDVEDATAEEVSVSFHRHYGQGADAAQALQAAQRTMLENESRGTRWVLSWAPFQVVGHASSPFESTDKRRNGGTDIGFHRTHSLHGDDGVHPQR